MTLPDAEAPAREHVDRLMALVRGLNDEDTKWIVTEDRIAGVRILDLNGPRRGVDSRCAMTTGLVDGRRIFVTQPRHGHSRR